VTLENMHYRDLVNLEVEVTTMMSDLDRWIADTRQRVERASLNVRGYLADTLGSLEDARSDLKHVERDVIEELCHRQL
jgi:hypothetical protein